MPDFKNLKKSISPADDATSAMNANALSDLQDDEGRRNKGLNEFMKKSLDPPSLDPDSGKDIQITPSELPFKNPMSAIKQKLSQYLPPESTEDKVPYDPNSGTIANIGRFALNNLASDRLSGAFPAAGSMKLLAPLMEEAAPRAGGILGGELAAKSAMNATAEKALQAAAPEGESMLQSQLKLLNPESAGPTMTDVARSQQSASRAIDQADRLRNSLKQAALNRLRSR